MARIRLIFCSKVVAGSDVISFRFVKNDSVLEVPSGVEGATDPPSFIGTRESGGSMQSPVWKNRRRKLLSCHDLYDGPSQIGTSVDRRLD